MSKWLSHQHDNYKNNEYIMKLNEDIRKQWEEFIEKYSEYFKSDIEKWKKNLNKLENYIIENGKLPSPENKDINIKYLGLWLYNQKNKYKNNTCNMKNEDIKKQWEEFTEKYKELFKSNEELWIDNLKKLEEFIIKNGKLPPQRDKDINIKQLGVWVQGQKRNYKKNDCIMKDEDIRNQFKEFIEKYKELF